MKRMDSNKKKKKNKREKKKLTRVFKRTTPEGTLSPLKDSRMPETETAQRRTAAKTAAAWAALRHTPCAIIHSDNIKTRKKTSD